MKVDYILIGAYEGSTYDTSKSAYIINDTPDVDAINDLLCSVANVKPASGGSESQPLRRASTEMMANNRGAGFHIETIKSISARQLLMIIEMGMMNMQTAIGQGVTTIPSIYGSNCSSLTGSTSYLGNATGTALETINTRGSIRSIETEDGKKSVTYRGVENPYGNINKFINGINIWGDGHMAGGQPYICTDFNFEEQKNIDNYSGAGFTLNAGGGYISAMGYSEAYDWLFLPSECHGNSGLPVGDIGKEFKALNSYSYAYVGGKWSDELNSGIFYWNTLNSNGVYSYSIGARLIYIPTAE